MRKHTLLASAAIAALFSTAALAQESPTTPPNAPAADAATDTDKSQTNSTTNPAVETGAAAGTAAGAVAGAVVGGPVGAVIGGFAGAILGSAAAVPQPAVDYVVANPVEPVVVQGGVSEGMTLPESVSLTTIPDYPDYSYVYVDGRPVLVKASSRQVVYSPGYVVPEQTVTYVQSNRLDPVQADVTWSVGAVVPDSVELVDVPSDPAYAYVYTDTGPVLVNRSSRTVVWVSGS